MDIDGGASKRYRAKHKGQAVLRLLHGEDIALVSRDIGLMATTLASERRLFRGRRSQSEATSGQKIRQDWAANGKRAAPGEDRPDAAPPFGTPKLEEVSQATLSSAGKAYGLARVCRIWGRPRSTVYWQRQQPKGQGQRRGSQGFQSNAALAGQIKVEIASRPFPGESYRKIEAGLQARGIRTSPTRTFRLMRENALLAPARTGHPHGPTAHDGMLKMHRVDRSGART